MRTRADQRQDLHPLARLPDDDDPKVRVGQAQPAHHPVTLAVQNIGIDDGELGAVRPQEMRLDAAPVRCRQNRIG
ncbi:hypothetical protein [Sphingomonas aerolata]|uniref:hypothetical protein n=1 Tax=Sphingomonas aerolata TaxID=185951 RepID=UPI003A5BF75C